MTVELNSRKRLSSEVAERLAERIASGDIETGAVLPSERDLCQEYGVGRPTVREAMIHLENSGLLDSSAGRRPRVRQPSLGVEFSRLTGALNTFLKTPDGYGHLEQARMFLETGLVRYAVDHATPAQISNLHKALMACDAAIGKDTPFRKADVAFHRSLAEMPGNPIIVHLHDAVVEWLIERRPESKSVEEHTRVSQSEHVKIFEAVVKKEKQAAEDLMAAHLNRAYYLYFLGADTQAADTEGLSDAG